jgi:LmbE family N-acetylglucosaminyl deacetylase
MSIDRDNPGAVLVVAAHPDDEVLGCGGTLARMARQGRAVHVLLLADGETARLSGSDASAAAGLLARRNAAADAAAAVLGCTSVDVLGLPDNRLDSVDLLDIVKQVETFVQRYRPTTVFTHHAGDLNIDHRVAQDAVVTACRPQPGHPVRELLFFEVPSATEWRPPSSARAFAPDWFVDVSATLALKMQALEAYAAELRPFPHARSLEAVTALARWRGASAGVEAAEAFELGRKIVA